MPPANPSASRWKLALVLGLLGVVLVFLSAAAGFFIGNLFMDHGDAEYRVLLAAFLGAFFAFTLGTISRIATELERRERNGFLALVYLQRYFNSVLPNLGRLQEHLKGMLKAIGAGGWWALSLEQLPEPIEEHWRDIPYQEALNRVFAVIVRIGQINRNSKNMNEWYRNIKEHPSPTEQPDISARKATILANLGRITTELDKHLKDTQETEANIIRVVAELRILEVRARPLMNLLTRLYLGTTKAEVDSHEIEREIAKIAAERKEPKLP